MTEKEKAAAKRAEKLEREKERVHAMRTFEENAVREKFGGSFPDWPLTDDGTDRAAEDGLDSGTEAGATGTTEGEKKHRILLCGIDEAGRGPLAGPVAAGACILPLDHDILYINDSKKLSAKKREELYEVITREALAWNVAMVSPARIDEINILQATFEAMRAAVEGLHRPAAADAFEEAVLNNAPSDKASSEHKPSACRSSGGAPDREKITPDVLVVDAVHIPQIDIPQCDIIKADAQCASVAAASILAKVTRDRYMEEMDKRYPGYGFAAHKGYGTKAHIEALKALGPCPIHRRTFISHFI